MSTNHKKKRRYNDDVDDDDDTDDSNTGGSDSSSSSSSESNNGVYESEAFKKFEYASGSDDDDDEDEDGEAADGKDERNKRYTYSMVNGKIRRTPSKSKAARFSINRSTNAGTTTAGRSRVYSGINGDDGDSDNDDDEACDNIFDVSKRGKEEKERRKQSKAITWKTQFIGSVWKNARYLKRNHTRLAWIIAFPLFVLWAVWGTMCGVLAVNKPISTYNHPLMDYPEALLPSFSATEATGMCNKERSSCGLAVYPSDASTWSIGFLLRDALKDPATGRKPAINYFDDEDELAKEMSDFPGKHFAGVAFHCRWGACRNYTMYMSAELLPLRADESRDASVNVFSPITAAYHNASLYVSSGLVTLQNAVDSSLTRTETLSQHFFNLTVRTKLLPADPVNYIALPLGALLSAGGGLALIPLLCACVELILFERIRRVRYYLFMLGMRKSAYWLALVLAVGIPGVAVGAGWVVVCTTAVWPGGGAAAVAILAVAWVGYLVTLLLFVFAVHKIADTRFWNFFIVTAFAGVLPAVGSLVPSGGTVQGVLATFLSPYTFYLAVASVVGDSLHGPDPTPFSTAEVLAYLLSNVVLYGLICCYINESCSGDYGVSRGPLFFIHRSYWRPARQTTLMEKAQFSKNALPPRNFEPPLAEDFGVRIYGLTKEYDGKTGRGKTGCAVHSLSAPFTKGQVTCILGQNGSGKTSLLAMLCGLVKPTSGEAVVDGRSILSDAGAIQKVVGYCPEADVLYPDLTPEDHVDLIACIRGTKSRLSGSKLTGLSSGNTKERPGLSGSGFAARVLSDVGLLDKRRSKASALTPGMRRRLTLALSLIGDPKIVFLDEPTGDASEVDIASKRIIWTALKRIRGARRTIVFTSRSIEEAEQLGDYVYFMDEGRFKCGGSPDFLERRFGVGYYLNVVTKAESKIKDVVKECVPAATFVASTTKSVLFRLPFSQTQLYSALFRRLENDAAALGVEKFKLHLNTLGDVFSKICTKGLAKPASESAAKPHSEKDSASEGDNEEEDEEDKLYSRNVAPSVEDYSPTNTQCMEGGVSSEGVHPSLPTSPNATSPVGFNASYGSRSMGAPGKSGHSHVMEKRRASFARQFAAVCKCKFIYFVRRATIFVPIVLVPLVYLVLSLFVVNGCFHVLDVNNEKAKLSFHNISRYEPSYIPFVLGTGSDVVLEDIDKLTQAMESPTLRMAPVENVSVLNHIAYSRGNNINAGLIFNAFNVNKNRADITIMYNQTDPTAPVAIMDFLHTGIYSLLRGKHCDPPGVWVSPVVTSAIRSAVTTPSSVSENLTYGIVGAIMTVLACVRISTKMAKSTIEERVSGFKSQLYEAGLRPVAYVLATVCTSLVPLISTYVIFEAVFAAFGVTEFAETSTFFIVFVGMLLFFISLWSFSIAFGNLFTSPSNGSRALYTILVILTVVPILLSLLFYFAPHSVASVFEFIFGLLSPPYAFANFLFSLLTQGKYISIESRLLWKNSLTESLLVLGMDAMVYILLCLGVEYWMDGNNKCYKTPGITGPESDEGDEGKAETLFADKDVEAEKNRVMQPESCCHDAVVIRGLQTVGVRRVTFGVHAGECFGLLGPGVSGKSSVLAAVAGQAVCVRGEIFANGVTLQDQQRLSLYHARAGMAYCSQRREFAGYLTGREHLELFASLRLADASRHDVSSIVQHAIRSIKLTGEADKQVKIYGTDATRKLCVATALLPGTSLALLDEPTNGTSSPARRAIWAFIHRESARLGKTVLLATHSMSEAEELCSTIGVMANGVLQSLGSMKVLKHKFSNKGYVVSVDLEPSSDIPEIEHLISSCCGKSSGGSSSGEKSEESIFTIENYTFRHTYALRSVTSLATLFDNLEKAHLRNGVRNYTVSQASLENVFLYVIRQHDEVQEDSDGMSLSGSPLFKRDEKRLRKSAHTPK